MKASTYMRDAPNVFTYPRNEPGTQGHLDLVEPLRTMPRDLERAIDGAGEDELRFHMDEQDWCMIEIIGHLADSTRINRQRLYMMSTQTDPVLDAFDPEALRTERTHAAGDVQAMLRSIRTWRSDTVDLLTSLVNWNWARAGQHATFGRMSIRQLVEHMIADEGAHLEEIRRLRDAYAASAS